MPIPIRKTWSVHERYDAMQTDDGSVTLIDRRLGSSFHSGCGAVTEACSVYVQNSELHRRMETQDSVSVLELGFGTGMNCLFALQVAAKSNCRFRYVGVERDWLPAEALEVIDFLSCLQTASNSGQCDTSHVGLADWLLECMTCQIRRNLEGKHARSGSYKFPDLELDITLELESSSIHNYLAVPCNERFDIVFFDAFAPEVQPELWSLEVLAQVYSRMNPGGVLVSYCVQSALQKILREIGFLVEKIPGPIGGKREVLRAIRP